MVKPWIKEGEKRVIAEHHNKQLVFQRFIMSNGARVNWSLFHGTKRGSAVILPITQDGYVVAIEQFKCGSNQVELELPCGNIEDKEQVLEAAARELLEETGYQTTTLIWLGNAKKMWHDTASSTGNFYAVLALDCVKKETQHLDFYEDIEIRFILLEEWLRMTECGDIGDVKAIVTTHLALRHLDRL